MARTIEQIKATITSKLQTSFTLSTSVAAEWRLWVHCMAYCIYMFEVALDLFKTEMESNTQKEVAGTLTWYNEKCYEFQLGHELIFDKTTGLLKYARLDESARIIKIASVNVVNNNLCFRVATKNSTNEIVPLKDVELLNFRNYIEAIKFAGTKSQIISTLADSVRYELVVYYNPAHSVTAVESLVQSALSEFKTSQRFGGVLYRHKLIEAITSVDGVVTAKLIRLELSNTEIPTFNEIDTLAYLHSGYFDYTKDSILTLTSINDF